MVVSIRAGKRRSTSSGRYSSVQSRWASSGSARVRLWRLRSLRWPVAAICPLCVSRCWSLRPASGVVAEAVAVDQKFDPHRLTRERGHVVGDVQPCLVVSAFVPDRREIAVWPGPHVIPTRGPGAHAIVAFLRRQLSINDA